MDWRIYHSVNDFVWRHHWLGTLFKGIETYGTVLIAVAAFALWFFARPGGDRKWKLAAGSALGAAALGLVINRIIAAIHHRDRPYQTHPAAHVFGPHKTDASMPSDHATAALAIAVAVLLIDTGVGLLFLALAVLIAIGRVIIGEHYPGDVLVSTLIGVSVAFVVVRLGRPVIAAIVRVVERVTDPLLAAVWRTRTTGR
ncbi:MAG TPA: phosphatase PAP2 family protein [Gaiellaceae bacterium]|nr:phosphatase PAP2 family protein [Gaiellaceae bacterium]